jgi:hypothetical protein
VHGGPLGERTKRIATEWPKLGFFLRSYDSKQHHLGTFATKQEAALAHDRKARQGGRGGPLNCEREEAAAAAATSV